MDIKSHLKILYWFCLLWGMLNFVYDTRSQRFIPSHRLHLISKILYSIVGFISCYVALLLSSKGILWLSLETRDLTKDSFLAQDEIIEYIEYTSRYIVISVNVITFLKRKRHIRRSVTELHKIFKFIRDRTGNKIFIYSSIQYLFYIKLVFGIYRFVRFIARCLYYLIKIREPSALFGEMLWQACSWSHMYAYLLLICFYVKLDLYLSRFLYRLQRVDNDKRLLEVISVSFRIHRVKKRIEFIYSPFLVLIYYGLFNDITNSFGIMKEVLYKDYIVGHPDPPMQKVSSLLQSFPDGISMTFEIYMIGCISDALQNAEKLLQDKIIIFGSNEQIFTYAHVRKDIETQLIHNKLHVLSIWAYRLFKIDQGFAFQNFLNVVVMYVIICLQYFARESIYSSSAANRQLIANYTKFSKKVAYNF